MLYCRIILEALAEDIVSLATNFCFVEFFDERVIAAVWSCVSRERTILSSKTGNHLFLKMCLETDCFATCYPSRNRASWVVKPISAFAVAY